MDILTYYDRQDDYKIDKAEWLSNKCLGALRTAIGKKVKVSYYKGQQTLSVEYSSAKAKTALIVLAILLLPLTILITTIGILVYPLSKTHGKNILIEKKVVAEEECDISASPISRSNSPDLKLPSPSKQSPRPNSPDSHDSPPPPPSISNSPRSPETSLPVSPVEDSDDLEVRAPVIQVELIKDEYLTLSPEKFISLVEERGNDILCLNIENTTLSLSNLLPKIPNIKTLILRKCNFGDEGLSGFSATLNSLYKLRIYDCDLTSDDVKTLNAVRFSNLKYLDLSKNWIDDKGLGSILMSVKDCKLFSLDLSENQISSIGYNNDALFYLEVLDLSNNPQDDESVSALLNLPNLRTLLLKSEQITESGYKKIEDWSKQWHDRSFIKVPL